MNNQTILTHSNGYTGSCEFSEADQVYYGKILHINDLVSYEGETPEEIKNAFIEAVDEYLDLKEAL